MFRYLFLTVLAFAPLTLLAQAPAPIVPASLPTAVIGAIVPSAVPVSSVAEVNKTLRQPNVVLLDVRTPEEYATGHLAGAGNLDFRAPDLGAQLQQLDRNKTYVLYCASGNRSNKTAMLMQEKGFLHVVNAGAYQDLKDKVQLEVKKKK
ncbi:rhodanese-like domain-containing protein [Hymenobacter psychrophilus]|uniref:Rhodanese-related sulfurtransferase n=1 Tax=Hymenobacter psychrophilus TaxID=651662 RepID=A0A1H3CSP8_9BACT|nr:rhodanese-like domain-containing protein [Hymenobacter psychrophilus]SDX57070.1 Rhodanese-related sulfurtransferase [Hymenobacter psychrophilus]